MSEMTIAEALNLLRPEPAAIPEQTSKYVRWFDKEMRCASKGCSSPTYIKVEGVPYCMMHTIRKLTEILDALEVEVSDLQRYGPTDD